MPPDRASDVLTTVTALVFAEQFGHLREVAEHRGWGLKQAGGSRFVLVLPARDGSRFGLNVECDGYPGSPPAWHWCNPETGTCDLPADTPRGSGFFHGSLCICAPWNRLAYKNVNPNAPHGDWELSTWMTNPNTGVCTTLAAMALRLAVELQTTRYERRAG